MVFYLHITNLKLPSIWDVLESRWCYICWVPCFLSFHFNSYFECSLQSFVCHYLCFLFLREFNNFLLIQRANPTNLPSRFIFPLVKSLMLMHCIVGWKFCKRWSMACSHCRDKQCIGPPWVYCKGLVQSISDIQWAGIIGSFLLVNSNYPFPHPTTHTHPSHKVYKWVPLCQCWHVKQESLVRVAVWCIGEYGDMLVNNIGMLDIEDPIVVSTLPMLFFYIFFFIFLKLYYYYYSFLWWTFYTILLVIRVLKKFSLKMKEYRREDKKSSELA